MAIAVVANANVQSTAGGTTAGITTTTADLIVIAVEYYKGTGATPTDSVGGGAGNTWNALTAYASASGNSEVRIYWCNPTNVGASHTFSTTADFSGLCVLAVSGARTATTPFDQETGSAGGSSANPQGPGSITPSVNGCLVVTGFYQAVPFGAPGIPSGYTSFGNWGVGSAFPGGAAYQIQTTATATNPTRTPSSAGDSYATNVASFFPPAVAATATPAFLLNFM